MKRLLLLCWLVGCGGGGAGETTQRELCGDVAASLCERQTTCDPRLDLAACVDEQIAQCCHESDCAGPPAWNHAQAAACFTEIERSTCSRLLEGRPSECVPPMPATLATKWKLVARGYEFGCAAFVTPEVSIEVQGTTQLPPATAACSAGVSVATVPEGAYSVRGAIRSQGDELKAANTQITVEGASTATLTFRFDEFALAGEFSDSFTSTFCPRCGGSNPLGCSDAVRRWACQDADTCELPTWGYSSDLARCKADVYAMPCDAETIPDSCVYFRQLLPGLVR